MKPDALDLIRAQYQNSHGDATGLFELILSMAAEGGLDATLALLEQCVLEKRAAWLDGHAEALAQSGDPVLDGYRLFYEHYLGLSLPQDGELVEANPRRITVRWRNPCPTLEACQKLGLDPREICRKVYERPVQQMLSRLDARLRFRRNYAALRPQAAFCEESIELEEDGDPAQAA